MSHLTGKRVAILATDGFEQSELTEPLRALREHKADVDIVSLDGGRIQGFKHFDKGDQVDVDHVLSEVSAKDYDALVIPGGLFNPDALRVDDQALAFTRGFFEAGKPVGAICHGPWVLANADVPRAMVDAFLAAPGALGDRLITALIAARDAGGEAGPVHSAGLLMVDAATWPIAELRCDWSDDARPIEAVARAWEVYAPQMPAYLQRAIDPREAPSYGVPGDE